MIAETLIFEPDEGSIAVMQGPDRTIKVSFRHNNVLIGKYLTEKQAEELAQFLTECLATLPQIAPSNKASPFRPASQACTPNRKPNG